MNKLYILLLLALPVTALGQSKIAAPTGIWPELQLSADVGEDGVLFIRNQYRISTDSRYNDLEETGILSGFERIEFSLGYEHVFSDHWRAGAIYRYAIENFPETAFYGLFIRHNGAIKSLYFNKQLLAEYTDQEGMEAFARFRFSAELGKRLPLKSKFVTPSISYEALLRSEFGKEDDNADERTIDRTRLRLGLNFELTERLRINPYFMRQTEYYYVLVPPVYDEKEQLLEEGYTAKRNRVMPVVGLAVKYTIGKTPQTASITY